jgi:hypothetical protein
MLLKRRKPLRAVFGVAERLRVGRVNILCSLFERRYGVPLTLALGERILARSRVASKLRGLIACVGKRDVPKTAEAEVTAPTFRADLAAPDPSLRARRIDNEIQAVAVPIAAWRFEVADAHGRKTVPWVLPRGFRARHVSLFAQEDVIPHSIPQFLTDASVA